MSATNDAGAARTGAETTRKPDPRYKRPAVDWESRAFEHGDPAEAV